MGLLDRLRGGSEYDGGSLLLLPSGVHPDRVDALVAAWAPTRVRDGDSWHLAEGLEWSGPTAIDSDIAQSLGLPLGYTYAYVARTRRDREERPGRTTADVPSAYDAETATYYPHGRPRRAELDGWNLVCGLARRLGGVCRLGGGDFALPPLVEPDPAYAEVAGRIRVSADDVATWVAADLGELRPYDEVGPEDDWSLVGADDRVRIELVTSDVDLAHRDPELMPLAWYDSLGGRPYAYSVEVLTGQGLALESVVRDLVTRTDGLVVDEEGFPLDLPPA